MLVKLVKAVFIEVDATKQDGSRGRTLGHAHLHLFPIWSLHEEHETLTCSLRHGDMELVHIPGGLDIFHKDTNSRLLKTLLSQDDGVLQPLDVLVQGFKLVRNRGFGIASQIQQNLQFLGHALNFGELRVNLCESKLVGHRGK